MKFIPKQSFLHEEQKNNKKPDNKSPIYIIVYMCLGFCMRYLIYRWCEPGNQEAKSQQKEKREFDHSYNDFENVLYSFVLYLPILLLLLLFLL